MKYSIKKQQGIGLIEVLITTVVVAVGLLAIASLQGKLMGSSSSNKTYAEAKALCENRLEQLRDTATKGVDSSTTLGEYSAIGMSPPAVVTVLTAATRRGVTTETGITGVNETFTRVLTVTELTNPSRKQISVTCSWGNGDDEHKTVVQSILAFDSLGGAIKVANPSGLALQNPSTNAGSSTEITDKTAAEITDPNVPIGSQTWAGKEAGQYLKPNNNGTGTGSVVYKCKGETASGSGATEVIPFITFDADKGLYTRRIHNPKEEGTFIDAIELAKQNTTVISGVTVGDNFFGGGVDSCTRKIRYNGGIMLPIKGTVYSKVTRGQLIDIHLFTFDASESGIYCAFTPTSGSTQAPYICYAGGNCKNGPVGTTATTNGLTFTTATAGDNTIVTQCPSVTPTGTVYDNVGPGGWRGEVGLLGIPTSNAAHNNVCFAEEVAATPVTFNTARNYYTRRGTGTAATNEGLNKPYVCHDFLIVDGQNTEAALHTECAKPAIRGVLKLASKNIVRTPGTSDTTSGVFDGTPTFTDTTITTDNSVVTLNELDSNSNQSSKYSCHIITGTVTNGVTKVTATTTTGYFDCTVNSSAHTYECDGTAIGIDTGTTGSPVYSASVLVSEASPYASPLTSGYTPRTCTTSLTTSNTNLTCNLAGAITNRNIAVTVNNNGATTGTSAVTAVLDANSPSGFTCVQNGTTNLYNCTALSTWTGTIKAANTCNGSAASNATVNIASDTTTSATITLPVCTAATTHDLVVTVNRSGAGTTAITGVTTGGGVTCALTTGTTYNCPAVANAWTGTVAVASTCNGNAIANTSSATLALNATTVSIDLPSCAAVNYTLTVTPPTNGVIKDSLATPDINCGSACTHNYISGTSVFLQAVPNATYGFLSWGGACSSITINTCTVDMLSAKTVSAVFTPAYTLTTAVSPTGSGTISPATSVYNSGTTKTVTATANTGYVFSNWSGACTGTGTCSVTMNAAKSVTATFVRTCTLGGTTVNSGQSITAYSATTAIYPATCVSQSRVCQANGTLTLTYANDTCTQKCKVPAINGDGTNSATKIAAVATKVTDAGLVASGTSNNSLALSKVYNQSPAANTEVSCGSTVTYEYKP